MKNQLLFLFLFISIFIYAQTPQAFKYQAVVRDSGGEIIKTQPIGVRISIHDETAGGTIIYQETFTETTNDYGLLILNIGTGTPVIGAFNSINWTLNDKFIEMELDETGGTNYISIGTSQLLSVPFALYSNTSGNDGDWNFNENKLYYNGGDVGIGTNNPEQYGNAGKTLDVNGGIQSRYGIGIKRNDAWSGFTWSGNNWGSTWALGLAGDNAKSHIRFNSNSLFTINNEGNVGIGTDEPDMELCLDDEWGSGRLSWRRSGVEIGRLDSDGSYGRLFLKNQGYIGVYLVAQGTSYFTGGNIGIGLTNPSTKLEVDGTITATSFSGDGSGLTGISGDNLGNHQATQNIRLNNYWISNDGGNEGVYINDEGNVGVGISDPQIIFDVFGNNTAMINGMIARFSSDDPDYSRIVIDGISGADAQISFQHNGASKWTLGNDASRNDSFVLRHGFGAFGTDDILIIPDNGQADFNLPMLGNQGGLTIGKQAAQVSNNTFSIVRSIGAHSVDTRYVNGFWAQSFGAYNDNIKLGNIGLAGSDKNIVDFMSFGSGGNEWWDDYSKFSVDKYGNVGIGRFAAHKSPSAKLEIDGSETYDLLKINNSDGDPVFIMDATGLVGIGLINPSTELEVDGTITATSFSGDGSGLTGISGDNFGNHQATQNIRLNNHWISNDGGNEGIYITNEGKIGVGTSIPDARLHIKAPSGYIGNPNNTIGLTVQGGLFNFENIMEIQDVSQNPLIVVSNTGKMGIGNDEPEAALHISGNGWPNSFVHLQGNEGYDAGFRLYEGEEVKWHIYNNAVEDQLMIYNSDFSEPIFIADQTYGNVGIGATGYLSYKLEVEDFFDAFYAKSVHYNHVGWVGNQFAGIRGYSDGGAPGDAAVKGWADNNALAGDFHGDVLISGSISKGSGSFLIDHPLDPENKLLRHNFMESPENLVVYRGKASLNAQGEGIVVLPDYFAALTKESEATVILTSIGKPFLSGYEWENDFTAFKIYGEAHREVSWMVSADRDDPVIHQLKRPVEELKGDQNPYCKKGKLMYPEAYGYPESSHNNIEEITIMNEDLNR